MVAALWSFPFAALRRPLMSPSTKSTIPAGIAFSCVSYALFNFHDAAVKLLVEGDIPVFEVLFTRSLAILIGCILIGGGRAHIARTIASPVMKPMMLRSVLLLGAWLCYYSAARDLPLGQLMTLYYAAPIAATLLAVPILKEIVPPIRWIAILTGFAGVAAASGITRLEVSGAALLALTAAVLWATATIYLRRTAMAEKTIVQMTITNAMFVIAMATATLFFWKTPTLQQVLLLLGTAIFGGLAQYALFESIRRAPVSVLAPFEYSALVWAFLLGYVIWGDEPTINVVIGALMIASAGLIIVLSERLAWKKEKAQQS